MAALKTSLGRLWLRGIRRGLSNVWREHDWTISLGALTGVFLLLQILLVLFVGMQGFEQVLKARTDVRLEFLEGATSQQIGEFVSAINQLDFVGESIYITKEQAYAQMQKHDPELIAFLEELQFENPFPDTIGITLISLSDYDKLADFVQQAQWQRTVDPTFLSETTQQEQQIVELLQLTSAGRTLSILFVLLTVGILIFITTELVRSRVVSRTEEVLVEHLSGAHGFSILLPFAVEAFVLLVGAIVLSSGLTYLLLMYVPHVVPSLASGGLLEPLAQQMKPLILAASGMYIAAELAVALLIGWFGGWLGILPKINTRSLALAHQ